MVWPRLLECLCVSFEWAVTGNPGGVHDVLEYTWLEERFAKRISMSVLYLHPSKYGLLTQIITSLTRWVVDFAYLEIG